MRGPDSGVWEIRNYTSNMDETETICVGCAMCYLYASHMDTENNWDKITIAGDTFDGDSFLPTSYEVIGLG